MYYFFINLKLFFNFKYYYSILDIFGSPSKIYKQKLASEGCMYVAYKVYTKFYMVEMQQKIK